MPPRRDRSFLDGEKYQSSIRKDLLRRIKINSRHELETYLEEFSKKFQFASGQRIELTHGQWRCMFALLLLNAVTVLADPSAQRTLASLDDLGRRGARVKSKSLLQDPKISQKARNDSDILLRISENEKLVNSPDVQDVLDIVLLNSNYSQYLTHAAQMVKSLSQLPKDFVEATENIFSSRDYSEPKEAETSKSKEDGGVEDLSGLSSEFSEEYDARGYVADMSLQELQSLDLEPSWYAKAISFSNEFLTLPGAAAQDAPKKNLEKATQALAKKFAEKSFDELFDEATSRIEVIYGEKYHGPKDAEAVKEKFRQSLKALIKEGREKEVRLFIATIDRVMLYDYYKMLPSERFEEGASGYIKSEDTVILRFNFDTDEQDIGEIEHECLIHRNQIIGRSYPARKYLNNCFRAVTNLNEEAYKCLFGSVSREECVKILRFASEFEHRPFVVSYAAQQKYMQEFLKKFEIDITSKVINGDVKQYELDHFSKSGKPVKLNPQQQEIFKMFGEILFWSEKYKYQNSYALNEEKFLVEKPQKEENSGWLQSLFGSSYEKKILEFFSGLIELEAYLHSAIPHRVIQEVCGEREVDDDQEFLRSVEELFIRNGDKISKHAAVKLTEAGIPFKSPTVINDRTGLQFPSTTLVAKLLQKIDGRHNDGKGEL